MEYATPTLRDTHYKFGAFFLDPSEQCLFLEDAPIPLAPKAFELLVALIARQGRLLTCETPMKTVWPDSYAEETNLTVNICLLCKVLGEMPGGRALDLHGAQAWLPF